MKSMRYFILPMVSLMIFVLLAPYSSASESNAANSESKYIAFTETYWQEEPPVMLLTDEGEEAVQQQIKGKYVTSKYEVWFNKQGHYRFDVIEGPYAGNYEIWDGYILYQYNKMTNDIVVRDYSNENVNPIPHLFLSETVTERIKSDIKNGILSINQKSTGDISHLEKNGLEGQAKTKTEITLDKDRNIVLSSIYSRDDKVTHSLIINEYKSDVEFNLSLLSVPTNVPKFQLK